MASGLPDRIDAGPVVLCRRRVADVPELTAAIRSSIDDLSAFLRWAASGVPTREQLEGSATARDADFEAGTGFEYVMREAASDDLVGETGGDVRADASVVEIGYWLRTDRTGRGYATAAAEAIISSAFAAWPRVTHVEIRMDKGNVRSRAVAERLGFALTGQETFVDLPLKGQTGQGWIWSIDRDTWARTRP